MVFKRFIMDKFIILFLFGLLTSQNLHKQLLMLSFSDFNLNFESLAQVNENITQLPPAPLRHYEIMVKTKVDVLC